MMRRAVAPLADARGGRVENGVASLEAVRLNGSEQWIQVRGRRPDAPLLLYLSGGPCGSEMAWVRHFQSGLEAHFVVVHWDQRGAARSYRAADWGAISPEQMTEDAGELIELLLRRFGRRRLVLAGNSWGSILGVMVARRWPQRLFAYVGLTQQVNVRETDRLGWERTLARARAAGNEADVRALEGIGPPPYPPTEFVRRYLTLILRENKYGATDATRAVSGEQWKVVLTAPEYGPLDKVAFGLGLYKGWKHVYAQLGDLDFERDVPRVDAPVVLVLGREDITVSPEPAARWFEALEAPHKELHWIEGADHNLVISNRAEVHRLFVERVLPLAE